MNAIAYKGYRIVDFGDGDGNVNVETEYGVLAILISSVDEAKRLIDAGAFDEPELPPFDTVSDEEIERNMQGL